MVQQITGSRLSPTVRLRMGLVEGWYDMWEELISHDWVGGMYDASSKMSGDTSNMSSEVVDVFDKSPLSL